MKLKMQSVGALVRPTTRDAPQLDALVVAAQFGVAAFSVVFALVAFCDFYLSQLWATALYTRWASYSAFGIVAGLAAFGAQLWQLLVADGQREHAEHERAMDQYQSLMQLERKEREARLPARTSTTRYIVQPSAPAALPQIDEEWLAANVAPQTIAGNAVDNADLVEFVRQGAVRGFGRPNLADIEPHIVMPSRKLLTRDYYRKLRDELMARGVLRMGRESNTTKTILAMELSEALALLNDAHVLPSPIETVVPSNTAATR